MRKAINELKSVIIQSDSYLDEHDIECIQAFRQEKVNSELMSHEKLLEDLGLEC